MSPNHPVRASRGKMSRMISWFAKSGPEPREWGSHACSPHATIVSPLASPPLRRTAVSISMRRSSEVSASPLNERLPSLRMREARRISMPRVIPASAMRSAFSISCTSWRDLISRSGWNDPRTGFRSRPSFFRSRASPRGKSCGTLISWAPFEVIQVAVTFACEGFLSVDWQIVFSTSE